MKKLLSLMLLCMVCMGAWAQLPQVIKTVSAPIDITALEEGVETPVLMHVGASGAYGFVYYRTSDSRFVIDQVMHNDIQNALSNAYEFTITKVAGETPLYRVKACINNGYLPGWPTSSSGGFGTGNLGGNGTYVTEFTATASANTTNNLDGGNVYTFRANLSNGQIVSKNGGVFQATNNEAPLQFCTYTKELWSGVNGLYGNIVKRAVNPATTIEEGWYVLNNVGRANCVKDNGSAFKMASLISGYTGVTENTLGYLFHITRSETDGKWNIVSGLGHGISLDNNSSSQTADKHNFTIELLDGQTDIFYMKDENTGYIGDGQDTGNNFVGYGTTAPTSNTGNARYKFYKIEEGVVCARDLGHMKDAKWYQLNVRNKYVKYDANSKTYYDTYATADASDNTRWFAFVGNNTDGYKIFNYAAGANVAMGADNVNTDTRLKAVPYDNAQSFKFESVTYENAPALQIREINDNNAFLNQQATNLGYWNSDQRGDEGNVFVFTEVEDASYNYVAFDCTATNNGEDEITWKTAAFTAENTAAVSMVSGGEFITNITITDGDKTLGEGKYEFNVTADHSYPFAAGKFYLLKNRYDNNHVAVDNNEKTYARSTRNMDKANYLWSFERVENTPDQFYVKNLALDKYLSGTSGVVSYNASKTNAYTIWKDTQKNTENGFCLHLASSTSANDVCVGSHAAGSNLDSDFPNTVHDDGNTSLSVWTRGDSGARKDNGSIFWVEEFDESVFDLGQEGYVGSYQSSTEFNSAKDTYTSNKSGANLKAALTAKADLSRIEFTANKFYSFRHAKDNKHTYTWLTSAVSNRSGEDRMTMSHEETPDATGIFYWNGTNLIAFNNGLYANNKATSMDAYAWTITNATGNEYLIKNGSNRLTYWGYDGDATSAVHNDVLITTDSDNDGWSTWMIKEVETLPTNMVNVAGAYYASLHLPVAVTLPAGVTAYSGEVEGDVLTLTKVVEGAALAAYSPVILYSESEVTDPFAITTDGTAANGDLSGTTNAVPATGLFEGAYVLNKSGDNVGFYKTTSKINGFKAYLGAGAASSEVQKFSFNFNDEMTTAIRAIESENSGAEIFDAAGNRLKKAQKGMNIINGHKVIVK